MKSRLSRFFVAAALVLLAADAGARPSLDGARLDELERYQVLVFGDAFAHGIDRGKAIGVFDATSEEVYRVASDFNRWAEYLPRVVSSRTLAHAGNDTLVQVTAELPWPVGRREVFARYTTERLPGDIFRIRFEMVRGAMRQYLGSIYIEPWTSPDAWAKTVVTYELVAEPDLYAPRSALNKAVRRSASGFVHALRQRINDMHRLGLLHPLQPAQPKVASKPRTEVTADAKPEKK